MIKTNENKLLKDIAYEKIKDLILSEQFQLNQMLSERELIELLQMSKTPIKSALVKLESEGFVKVSSKQGIMILDLSLERIMSIYDLRTALETFVCKQLNGKLTSEQKDLITDNLERTRPVVEDLDVHNFTRLDHEYHLMLASFTGNTEIHRVLLLYHDHLQRITYRHLRKDPTRMVGFYKEHVEIFNQIKEGGDPVTIMENHLQKSKQKLFL